jgi:hypothetical protein
MLQEQGGFWGGFVKVLIILGIIAMIGDFSKELNSL